MALVAVGAAIGGVSGWFASEMARDPATPGELRVLEKRVAEVERRVPDDRERPVRRRDRIDPRTAGVEPPSHSAEGASPGEGSPEWLDRVQRGEAARANTHRGDGGIPKTAPPEFVDLVRSAIDEIKRQDDEQRTDKKVADQRGKYLREVDKKLVNYRDKLGMTDEQVAAFRRVAEAGVDARLAAQAEGLERSELEALDRVRHREFRDVLGGDGYREFRKLELDAVARPVIVSISGQAGVDREQRDRIERLLDEHIESIVDLDVKLRTEEIDGKERTAIHERMRDASRSAWDRLRGSILDAEQRGRVPKRLR